jgi:hypothetical protein
MKIREPIEFTERVISLIKKQIPGDVPTRKIERLPRILRAWANGPISSLAEPTAGASADKCQRLKKLEKAAAAFGDALGEAMAVGDILQVCQILFVFPGVCTADAEDLQKQAFQIAELAGAAAARRTSRGRPPNTAADIVIADIAAIFEWLTGRAAARLICPVNHEPVGEFFAFAGAIWPVIFALGDSGLDEAMKRLARKRRDGTQSESTVLANIAALHPQWEIFD